MSDGVIVPYGLFDQTRQPAGSDAENQREARKEAGVA